MPFHHMPCPDYQAQPTHGGPNGIASFNVVLGLSSIRRFGVMLSQGKSTKRSSPLPSRIPQHDDSIMYESTANSRLGEWNPVRSTSKSSRLILSVSNTTSSMPLAQGRLSPVPPAESHDGAVRHR